MPLTDLYPCTREEQKQREHREGHRSLPLWEESVITLQAGDKQQSHLQHTNSFSPLSIASQRNDLQIFSKLALLIKELSFGEGDSVDKKKERREQTLRYIKYIKVVWGHRTLA